MTRDHRRKKIIRAHAAAVGRSYMDAAATLATAPLGSRPVLAEGFRAELMSTLSAWGWPVSTSASYLTFLCLDAGPASVELTRDAEPARGEKKDGCYRQVHPDNATEFDLTVPLLLSVDAPVVPNFPAGLNRQAGVYKELLVGKSVSEIVTHLDQTLTEARRLDMAETLARGRCGVCADSYPQGQLLAPADGSPRVCPCCVFDGEVASPDPLSFAAQLSTLLHEWLSVPAGWAAVHILLCGLIGSDLTVLIGKTTQSGERLYSWHVPPYNRWIWLSRPADRPIALAGLGCGASIDHIVELVAQAHPDLRSQVREAVRQRAPFLQDLSGAQQRVEHTIDRLWAAIIAYTVAMSTQEAERPKHRSPWQVVDSFELVEWIDSLRSDLHYLVVKTVLREGILTARTVLLPHRQHVN